jgi:hypothetical protein
LRSSISLAFARRSALAIFTKATHSAGVSKVPLYFSSKSWTVLGEAPSAAVAVDTDGSDSFANKFVKYAVLVGRRSPVVGIDPFKFEVHLDSPVRPMVLHTLVRGAPVRCDLMLCAFQSEVAGTDHNRELALKIVLHVRIARALGPPRHQPGQRPLLVRVKEHFRYRA